MLNIVLEKATQFIINYIKEYKRVGADGIVMAEPLTGMLSPDLAEEFSTPFVKRIREEVEDENFAFIYHNCGNGTIRMIDSILATGCKYLHFGDAIDLKDMMPKVPKDIYVMGNISPSKYFLGGSKESMYEVTTKLLEEMKNYSNFVLSSGCDIPPLAKWENIDAFIKAFEDYTNK